MDAPEEHTTSDNNSVNEDVMDKEALEALRYAYANFLNKKYTHEDDNTPFPIMSENAQGEVEFSPKYQNFKPKPGQRVAYRHNHGLTHCASTLSHVRNVLALNEKHAVKHVQNYILLQTSTIKDKEIFIAKLQIAMAFYVSGRIDESPANTQNYKTARKKSAQNFKDYVQLKQKDLIPTYFKNQQEVDIYTKHLEHPYFSLNPSDKNYLDINDPENAEAVTLKTLFYGSHCTDLTRLYHPILPRNQFNPPKPAVASDLTKAIPAPKTTSKQQELQHDIAMTFHSAAKLSRKMGGSTRFKYEPTSRKDHGMLPKPEADHAFKAAYPGIHIHLQDRRYFYTPNAPHDNTPVLIGGVPRLDPKKFLRCETDFDYCMKIVNKPIHKLTYEQEFNQRETRNILNDFIDEIKLIYLDVLSNFYLKHSRTITANRLANIKATNLEELREILTAEYNAINALPSLKYQLEFQNQPSIIKDAIHNALQKISPEKNDKKTNFQKLKEYGAHLLLYYVSERESSFKYKLTRKEDDSDYLRGRIKEAGELAHLLLSCKTENDFESAFKNPGSQGQTALAKYTSCHSDIATYLDYLITAFDKLKTNAKLNNEFIYPSAESKKINFRFVK